MRNESRGQGKWLLTDKTSQEPKPAESEETKRTMGLGFRTFEKKGLQFRQEFAGVEPIPRCNSISYAGDNTSPSQNRFWPMLDNHDWISLIVQNGVVSGPHLDYFTLNGNERYYDLRQGALHFFMIDSDQREPDGITAASIQGQ